MSKKKIVIIGGGAAGFFTAANLPVHKNYDIILIESGQELMKKIAISGGGRCNVTHSCFDPKQLVQFYPRGKNELLGPFNTFNPTHTLDWFKHRNVSIISEVDNRMFPSTNSSETIVNTLLNAALENKVQIIKGEKVHEIQWHSENKILVFSTNMKFEADFLVIATGSNFPFLKVLRQLDIKIIDPVASLFTFNIPDKKLTSLMGVSFSSVSLKIKNTKLQSTGPLLITHWGLSGPAVLKLSAWGARELAALNYQFTVSINFTTLNFDTVLKELQLYRQENSKKTINSHPMYGISKRFWNYMMGNSDIKENVQWANINKNQLVLLAKQLTDSEFNVQGKSTYKDEFVTAGGVALNEINFKNFEHKKLKGVYFIGEVLNIDGITGGFNFQNCWTGGYIVAKDIIDKV